jgi:putative membrane protein
MWAETLLAYLHFISISTTVFLLALEFAWYEPTLTIEQAKRLQKTDLFYFGGAIAILVTGIIRVFYVGKGSAFYLSNPIFFFKIALYLCWALFSLPPTFHFLSWRKTLKEGKTPEIPSEIYRRIRLFIILQLCTALLVPFFAVLMARGFRL